ncbi:MAG: ATP-binding cassette domain-containing protein, partial [Cytophagales bacterium]
MSEPVLKAIIKLFALVAKEDTVTKHEREYIEVFLSDHLNQKYVQNQLQLFDEYAKDASDKLGKLDQESIGKLCYEINQEVDQKQKTIVMVELMSLILADGNITETEERLAKSIGQAFNIATSDIDLIKTFIISKTPESIDNENILIVSSSGHAGSKTKTIRREEIDGFMSVLYIQSTNLFFSRYLGHSDVYLNGVPQKPGNINALATGSIVRWGVADAVYYGEIVNKFKNKSDQARTSFEAENISYRFKTGKLGLRQVTVHTESGNLVALMGASGAGKSTLLHVLNGTEKPLEGRVLINGIDIHKNPKKIEGVIGFVPQDDLLIEDLTVYQNLYFAAKLCFSDLNETEIDSLVLKTLEDLGLTQTRNLKVGSPLQKTISGGQRKRVNIGLELLREPAVLFVDEPTSGLSSRDSENIIDLLKELSLKGKLVFAVIHQPSSDIFKMFDKLVILDTGG